MEVVASAIVKIRTLTLLKYFQQFQLGEPSSGNDEKHGKGDTIYAMD